MFKKITNIITSRKNLILFFIILSNLVYIQSIYSQSFLTKTYTEEDGFKSSTVYDITQDSLGRLYCATRRGITVGTGEIWKNYSTPNDLLFNEPEFITTDGLGTVWALFKNTKISIQYLNNNKWERFHVANDYNLTSIKIMGFIVFNDGTDTSIIIAGYDSGIYYYHNDKWMRILYNEYFNANYINSMSEYEGGALISTNKGLFHLVGGKLKKIEPENFGNDKNILKAVKRDDKIWILKLNELGFIKENEYSVFKKGFNLFNSGIMTKGNLLPTSFGPIIFGTESKLFFADEDMDLIKLGEKNGLDDNFGAYVVFEDRENNVWVGTGRALTKIESFKFWNYSSSNGLPVDEVTAINVLKNNDVILCQYNYLSTINPATNTISTQIINKDNSQFEFNRILDVETDVNGYNWIAAIQQGFGRFKDLDDVEWFKPSPNDLGISIAKNSKNEVFALTNFDLYKFENNKFIKIQNPIKSSTVPVRKIFIDKEDNIWITSQNGVYKLNYESGLWTSYHSSDSKTNNIFCLYIDEESVLVGSINGLSLIDADSIKMYPQSGLNISNPVYMINRDDSGNLWFGCDNGVYKYNGKDLEHFNISSGLLGLEINRDGFYSINGRVYIGLNKGMAVYHEKYDIERNGDPLVFIDSIKVENKIYPPDENLELKSNQNTITVFFSASSFVSEQKIYKRFRLLDEGEFVDNNIIVDNNYVNFSNIAPGNYTIEIQIKTIEDRVSKTVSTRMISINSPFYYQPWFVALTIIIVILLLYSTFRFFFFVNYSKKLEHAVNNRTLELNQEKEKFEQMFLSNSAAMLLIRRGDWKILQMNYSALKYYGYKTEEVNNLNYSDLDYTKGSASLFELSNNIKTLHQLKSGEIRDVEIYLTELQNEEENFFYAIIYDITDRLNMESNLKESEEKYRILLSNIQDGVCVIQDQNFVFVNESFARILRYSKEDLIGNSYLDVIAKEYHELVLNNYFKRLQGESIQNEYELEFINSVGEKFLGRINAGVTRFSDKPAIIATLKDITEISEKEKELSRLYKAVEQSPVAIFITSTKGEIEYVNQSFADISGYTTTELMGKNPKILKSGTTDDETYKIMWKTISSAKTWRGEFLNVKKNGDEYWASATIEPIINEFGEIINYLAIEEDISYRKFAEEEIRKNERMIDSVLSSVPIVIFALNATGKLTFAKGREVNYYGVNISKLMGRNVFPVFRKMKSVLHDVQRALNGEAFTVTRRIRRDIYEIKYVPFYDNNGVFNGTMGIAYEVTERAKYEKELKVAKNTAEKSERLQSEFLAQMSHEIRTPVNSILNFTTLLKEDVGDKVSEDLHDIFDIIDSGGRRLARTIDMILNMSQIKTGTYKPDFNIVNLDKDILKNIVSELYSSANVKEIDLVYKNNLKSPKIIGDVYTIGQIFANLIDNAIKYTKKGSVTITVYNYMSDHIAVSIEDTGIGIKKEYIPSLFDAFSQEEQGYTRKFEGNGLGLALVKNYLNMNKAEIKVRSEKGVGSEFIVILKKA